MSKYYTAHVSNVGLDAIRSDFKIIIKADSLAQARSGVANRIIDVERATDQEIFEAGKNSNVVLDLSVLPTDGVHPDQQPLPIATTHAADMTQPSAHDGTVELAGATASGSAPAWLPQSVNAPATHTGD